MANIHFYPPIAKAQNGQNTNQMKMGYARRNVQTYVRVDFFAFLAFENATQRSLAVLLLYSQNYIKVKILSIKCDGNDKNI